MFKVNSLSFVNLFQNSLSIFLLLFCISPKFSSFGIILICFSVFFGYYKKEIFFKFNFPSLLILLLYVIYAIGCIWSSDSSIAFGYLEKKLSFLVFPLIFSFKTKNQEINLRNPILSFITGVFLLSLLGIWNSLSACFLITETSSFLCFSGTTLSHIHHPTYFSIFHYFSIILFWYANKNNFKGFTKRRLLIWIIFSCLFQFCLMSLSGVLFLNFTILVFLIYFFYKKVTSIKFIVLLLFLTLISFFSYKKIPYLKDEVQFSIQEVNQYCKSPSNYIYEKKYPFEGNSARLILWTSSFQVMLDHPFGVGTGNLDEVLSMKLKDNGQEDFSKLLLNPHNQYLQIGIELGFFGMMFFIFILFYSIFISLKSSNKVLLFLVLNLSFNSFFESILQRQSGIVFFVFWICLFLVYPFSLNSYKEGISKEK